MSHASSCKNMSTKVKTYEFPFAWGLVGFQSSLWFAITDLKTPEDHKVRQGCIQTNTVSAVSPFWYRTSLQQIRRVQRCLPVQRSQKWLPLFALKWQWKPGTSKSGIRTGLCRMILRTMVPETLFNKQTLIIDNGSFSSYVIWKWIITNNINFKTCH